MAGKEVGYDRLNALKQFDNSKEGVKGLVDSGASTIPQIFIHPPEVLADLTPATRSNEDSSIIPIINLSLCIDRSTIVDQVAKAAREFGFFQVVNHGIPIDVVDGMIGAIRGFNEQPVEVKQSYYRRDLAPRGVAYGSNLELFQSKAAVWRDSLRVKVGPTLPDLDEIPEICRSEIVEWDQQIKRLGDHLIDLLFEGLGRVSPGRVKEMKCSESRILVGQYYPHCPEPDRTIGFLPHTDQGVITILAQDQVGGLQIKYGGKWFDVKPIPGALVVNIGDMLQVMSNDEYKSVEHRAVANPFHESRVSVVVFINLDDDDRVCGPLPELISQDRPAVYRQFTLKEFKNIFFKRDGTRWRTYFKL